MLDFPPALSDMMVTVDIAADDVVETGSGEVFFAKLRPETNLVQVNIREDLAAITIVDNPCMYSTKPNNLIEYIDMRRWK